MVALLLENNADVRIRNDDGETPCDAEPYVGKLRKDSSFEVHLKAIRIIWKFIEISDNLQMVRLFGLFWSVK